MGGLDTVDHVGKFERVSGANGELEGLVIPLISARIAMATC